MTEPTITVDPNQVVFMLGQKEVELQLTRARADRAEAKLAEANAKIAALTPKPEPALEVVK